MASTITELDVSTMRRSAEPGAMNTALRMIFTARRALIIEASCVDVCVCVCVFVCACGFA